MSEKNESKQPVTAGSECSAGLGEELSAAYFFGFHQRDDEIRRLRELIKHPEWMKRIQRERMEERERCLRIFEERTRHVWEDNDLTMESLRAALYA